MILSGTLAVLLVLSIISSAQGSVVIGQSIAGVKLGDSAAQVETVLGPPTKNELGSLFYTSLGLRISVEHGKVGGILSTSKKQKTSKGITIGSSRSAVKRAYPKASCLEGPMGPQSLYCAVTARLGGRKTFTSFLFTTAKGGVVEVELGYGEGLAQELKKGGK
ncbi:MAG TPA: hypothetical protein VMD79_12395 [Solirubrobacteraceae bacterium]|nr:hypothetical protein [Solirubrobacteraceae bacterium]